MVKLNNKWLVGLIFMVLVIGSIWFLSTDEYSIIRYTVRGSQVNLWYDYNTSTANYQILFMGREDTLAGISEIWLDGTTWLDTKTFALSNSRSRGDEVNILNVSIPVPLANLSEGRHYIELRYTFRRYGNDYDDYCLNQYRDCENDYDSRGRVKCPYVSDAFSVYLKYMPCEVTKFPKFRDEQTQPVSIFAYAKDLDYSVKRVEFIVVNNTSTKEPESLISRILNWLRGLLK